MSLLFPASTPARYHPDALHCFQALRPGDHAEAVLLESADVTSGAHLQSLMLLRPALRLTCQGQAVTAQALTPTGHRALELLAEQLASHISAQSAGELTLHFAAPPTGLSESERLKFPSNVEPLRVLQRALNGQDELQPLLLGVFGFDLLASFERLPQVKEGVNTCPDYRFYLAETALVLDHQQETAQLLGLGTAASEGTLRAELDALAAQLERLDAPTPLLPLPTPLPQPQAQAFPDSATFQAQVSALQEHIQAGDIYQVVPSRRFTLPCPDALAAYAELKRLNPSPYLFYLHGGEFELFGASPESALKFTAAGRQAELYPIAGTRARGRDEEGRICPERDSRQELELRLDRKELSEHLMLLDLARNDLARVAVPGTRRVARLLDVDRYSQVMHLVSQVVAQLSPELDALDAYRACMNMGTLSGAPKLEATRLLRMTEGERRGSYGGAVGYLAGGGDMDTCIVIRSGFVQGGQCTVQAGAGVVRDSDPAAEAAETEQKARAVLLAVTLASGWGGNTADPISMRRPARREELA
ncbi:anthranilate synthase component 1 [Deinococcus piscis]|uniref:Anthranilate synthase component 1 n=1 Tax=Deinococcus piscis TaxID=394230 RepID=A0ABQ3JXQ9_9DEIO|nr:anthranilate synthase component 1 [Deinococcus piscis]GHF94531.1 anthranilate synthase component 1 [Deinococcus piscis]